MTASVAGATAPRARLARTARDAAVTLPFFGYLTVFLFLPTVIVIVGAFRNRDGGFTLDGVSKLFTPATGQIFLTTAWLSLASALIGAVVNLIWIVILSAINGGADIFAIALGVQAGIFFLIAVAITAPLVLRVFVRR